MPETVYQRVVLKLSGEALAGEGGIGLDFPRVRSLARDLGALTRLGTELLLVIGGGNLLRGRSARESGVPPVQADRIGMLGTVMNALALSAALDAEGVPVLALNATPLEPFAAPYTPERARAALADGKVVIAAGGIGQPFFSTDTTAALRAVEVEADCLLKATTVDGVFSGDPRKDPQAVRLPRLSYDEVVERQLAVMDATAFALCREHAVPVRVFNFMEPGALERVLKGEPLGSLVSEKERQR